MTPDPTQDVIELRLPLKLEYLNVIRATVGVIAGTLDFTYDEVMQFRVALSEIFELATHLAEHESPDDPGDISFRFEPQPEGRGVRVGAAVTVVRDLVAEEQDEGRALLDSLMDSVEFDTDGTVHMVKYRSIREGA